MALISPFNRSSCQDPGSAQASEPLRESLRVLVRVFLRVLVICSQHQLLRTAAAFLEIGEQPLVRQIERVRVLPIVMSDLFQPLHDIVVVKLNGQLAPVIEAAGSEID